MTKVGLILDKQGSEELSQQIYSFFKKQILSATLKSGTRLPSGRDLADELSVSRPTVALALEQLAAEGYVEIRPGSGTYVCQAIKPGRSKNQVSEPKQELPRLTAYGKTLLGFPKDRTTAAKTAIKVELSFSFWQPALDQFPLTEWARIVGRHVRQESGDSLGQMANPQGELILREQLCRFLEKYRSLRCVPNQILVTMGLKQSLDIFSRLHLEPHCAAYVEDPGYDLARQIFVAQGAQIKALSLDEQGLKTEDLPRTKRDRAKILYITPSHQFPTGSTLPVSRRLQLLDWAKKEDCLIFEDDYDSEYPASGRPIPALMSLDKDGRVIYAGSLNQVMFPALNIGYLVLPENLVDLYVQARSACAEQTPAFLQHAVANFMESGDLDKHIRKLSSLYKSRRNLLVNLLEKQLGTKLKIFGKESGVFVLARLDGSVKASELVKLAAAKGLELNSTLNFYCQPERDDEIILGFGKLTEKEIRRAVAILVKLLC